VQFFNSPPLLLQHQRSQATIPQREPTVQPSPNQLSRWLSHVLENRLGAGERRKRYLVLVGVKLFKTIECSKFNAQRSVLSAIFNVS
jgi:hypothetical protein